MRRPVGVPADEWQCAIELAYMLERLQQPGFTPPVSKLGEERVDARAAAIATVGDEDDD